ncbi:uncharacterized protein TRIADDRAFT_57482 [Trichoplax adhaerens]|uniref:Cation/H+ exchanger transmembrane domain-containing protein n=1 Tax=Trichoplax adhaerens TaxID=10228 RepID=B3RZJ8_TRIAD|nr:hypothetical protein TRIADDRAFT_57482 [Trichoplax adhaerens]EDV24216.1 hypothetical protein TRIADDRAFT_57482 [Trichoplax adhaerens]|eukprot:XP_002113742.1 hypothetical protein TRIADDRAFT_57482 [Trichoplax adhaerens]
MAEINDNKNYSGSISSNRICSPPSGKLARILTRILQVAIAYGLLWSILGKEALPGGNIFSLFVVITASALGGFIVAKLKGPALLGMLVVGFTLRNAPTINVAKSIDPKWSGTLRAMALAVILTRAGLGLDWKALIHQKFTVLRVAFLPCICETVVDAIVARYVMDLPWLWGIMLGFVMAAVSPAVVIPTLLSLQERGYGVNKGIPTLVIAAASIDDVFAISGFGVFLGIAFSTGDIIFNIFRGPVEILVGIAFGVVAGIVCWFFPNNDEDGVSRNRFVLLLSLNNLFIFGSRAVEFSGAGALAALVCSFVAAMQWRTTKETVEHSIDILWQLFQPILFGLIGAEVDINFLTGSIIGGSFAVLSAGLAIRVVVTYIGVSHNDLAWKEKLFVAIAWLPKATVQAAIGSIALDTARLRGNDPDDLRRGNVILTIAVLSILITAPLGAALIVLMGPKLLHHTPVAIDSSSSETNSHRSKNIYWNWSALRPEHLTV